MRCALCLGYPHTVCLRNRRGVREVHWAPLLGVSGRLGHAGYLVNSSNLLKATMAPIRWHSGEKPLSMKSSVLCLRRSGLVTLMGMAILQGNEKSGRRPLLKDLVPRAVPAREISEPD